MSKEESNLEEGSIDNYDIKESIVSEYSTSNIENMYQDNTHNLYAKLISRENQNSIKYNPVYNKEMKDFSQLRPAKMNETTDVNKIKEPISRKKNFELQKDLVKMNLDGSKGEDLQKAKYKYGRKRFDNLGVMDDYSKKVKKEEKFKCETINKISSARERKLKDQYSTNPMERLNKKQIEDINNKERKKVENRTKAFNNYMGSKNTQKLLKSYQTEPNFTDKITNKSANILKKTIKENRKAAPYYEKYKFKHYIQSGKKVTFLK
jgi:hypothetical protein